MMLRSYNKEILKKAISELTEPLNYYLESAVNSYLSIQFEQLEKICNHLGIDQSEDIETIQLELINELSTIDFMAPYLNTQTKEKIKDIHRHISKLQDDKFKLTELEIEEEREINKKINEDMQKLQTEFFIYDEHQNTISIKSLARYISNVNHNLKDLKEFAKNSFLQHNDTIQKIIILLGDACRDLRKYPAEGNKINFVKTLQNNLSAVKNKIALEGYFNFSLIKDEIEKYLQEAYSKENNYYQKLIFFSDFRQSHSHFAPILNKIKLGMQEIWENNHNDVVVKIW